jgi:uncharacterized surface protein with fasciclin (FAS1) repeats
MFKSIKIYLASSIALAVMFLMISGSLHAQGNTQGQKMKTNTKSNKKSVVDVVKSKKDLSKFASLLNKSGFAQVLNKQDTKFTVLAPDNDAVKNLGSKQKKNPKNLVQSQLFQGNVSKKVVEKQMGVNVKKTYDNADNGVVYVVDKFNNNSKQQQQQ